MIRTDTELHSTVVGEASSLSPSGRSVLLHGLAAALMFLSPLVVFVPAAILSSGLRNGRKGLWGSTALAAILLAMLGSLAGSPGAMTPVARMLFEVGLPSAVGLELIGRGLAVGPVLVATVLVSFGGIVLVEVVMRSFAGHSPWEAIASNFRAASEASAATYEQAGFPAESIAMMERVSNSIASTWMPLLIGTVTILMFALSYTMLPRLRNGRALVPAFLFRNLSLPVWVLFGFIAGGLAPLASGPVRMVGLNLLGLVALLYLLQGLAVLRFHQVRIRMGILATMLAVFSLLLLTPYGVTPAILFLFGLFDPFFDFRKFNRKEASHESNSD